MKNSILERFFVLQEINPQEISKKVDDKLHTKEEYLGILSKALIYKDSYFTEISIGDIYGRDFGTNNGNTTIFELMDDYFKEEPKQKKIFFDKTKSHANRSNENLLLSRYAMIEKSNSLPDAITVCRVDKINNICFIESNGMHRYLALRAIYLKELADNPKLEQEIKERFKIKVSLKDIDEIKTYCFFIINNYYKGLGKKVGCKKEVANYKYTGKLKVAIFDNDDIIEEYVFSDEELIEFVKPIIKSNLEYYESIEVPGFKNFIDLISHDKTYKLIIK